MVFCKMLSFPFVQPAVFQLRQLQSCSVSISLHPPGRRGKRESGPPRPWCCSAERRPCGRRRTGRSHDTFFPDPGSGYSGTGGICAGRGRFPHQPPLGRVGKGDDGHHGFRRVKKLHGLLQPRRGEEGGGGIDAAEAAEADASFFIFPQHLQDHVVRGGVVSRRIAGAKERDGGAPFFRDPRDLRIVRGNHHLVKGAGFQGGPDGIGKNGAAAEIADVLMGGCACSRRAP